MKDNILLCNVNSECIHRRGCKRWVGNYKKVDYNKKFIKEPIKNCIKTEHIPFYNLIRFRYSHIEGKTL